MAMNFPENPSVNDEFTVGDQTWVWTGTTWDTVTITEYSPSAHATTHELGGADELSLDPTQVTGLDELNTGTEGYTALSNGSSGLSYQPVSHNYIINGAFDIWQRGDGPFTGGFEYTADRWKNDSFSVVSTLRKSFTNGELDVEGFGNPKYYLNISANKGSNGFGRLDQRIEDVRTLAGQEVTLSFWSRKNDPTKSGIERVMLRQTFGSGGSPNTENSAPVTYSGTDWEKFSFTFTLPSMDGKTIEDGNYLGVFFFGEYDSFDFDFDLWGVQLEAGSIATPFKRNANSIAGELQACERYYQVIGDSTSGTQFVATGYTRSSSEFRAQVNLRTPMRENPDEIDVFGTLSIFNNTEHLLDMDSFNLFFESSTVGSFRCFGDTGETFNVNEFFVLQAISGSGKIGFGSEL